MAYNNLPDLGLWFGFNSPIAQMIGFKLILLGLTVVFALDARLRVIPVLKEDTLVEMAWHIIPVTLFSVVFVVVGVAGRF